MILERDQISIKYCLFCFPGHSRSVKIEGCVEFNVTTTACRGYCLSYAIPSSSRTLRTNPQHKITSRAECCSIEQTHDVSSIKK